MWQLNNFDVDEFLCGYWQKKPLLIRQAIADFSSPLSAQELAGLACEEGVYSRLVTEQNGDQPWQLQYGPFEERAFTALPESHYALLVSDCEKWLPELQDLIGLFGFIPRWRVNGVMICYASRYGSEGPHIDECDVFLIQASGSRKWSIEGEVKHNPELIPDLDLAVMQDFEPDQEWELSAGDMLYLPPHVARHGIANGDDCVTFYITFRAPTVGDILDSFLLEASDHKLIDKRYSDVNLQSNRNPAEITSKDIHQFKSLVQAALDQASPMWPDIVGKLLSDSTLSEDVVTVDCASLSQAVECEWYKHPDARLYFHNSGDRLRLFYNGKVKTFAASHQNINFCNMLCLQNDFSIGHIQSEYSKNCQEFFMQLIKDRSILPVVDDE